MSKLNVVLLAVGLTGAFAVSAACNSGGSAESTEPAAPEWSEVCAHLAEVMERDVSDEMCGEMEAEVSADCGDDTEAAMRCVMAAADMEAFGACEEICGDE